MSTLRQWLQERPYSLALSSGFFGFFAHCGVIAALEEQELWPQNVSGSSAGAIITGGWASGASAKEICEQLFTIKRSDFWDPYPGLGFLKGRLFYKKLCDILPTNDFSQCRFPLTISIYDVFAFRSIAINSGDIAKTICASCAVPGMFHPVWINKRPYLDGGIADHGGLLGLKDNSTRIFYHHLISGAHWQKKQELNPKPLQQKNMKTLIITGLPQVNPFALENGPDAYEKAYQITKQALDFPIDQIDNTLIVG